MLPGIMTGWSCLFPVVELHSSPALRGELRAEPLWDDPDAGVGCLVTLHILDLAVSRRHGVSLGSNPACWLTPAAPGRWNVQMYSAS
jgi:hypothetical protein